ncbi:MAG: ribosome-associated protein [Chlamydiales bacterium]|jgi:ribosome-associated protein
MKKSPYELLNIAAQELYDRKGFNILALDVREISSITDSILIAEGNIERHVTALSNAVIDQLQKHGEKPVYVEGQSEGDWVIIDYIDFMIHIFTPEFREKYQLEVLWNEGKLIDVDISVPQVAENGSV